MTMNAQTAEFREKQRSGNTKSSNIALTRRRRVQIFVEHDIIIRHFLLNHTFKELEKQFEVQYVFPKNDNRVTVPIDHLGLSSIVKIDVNRERITKLRVLAKIRVLNRARSLRKYRPTGYYLRTLFNRRTYYSMAFKSLPGIFPLYRWKIFNEVGKYVELEKAIEDFKPDVILHPTVLEGLFIGDLIRLTGEKNIPFIALMNSWDNPSSKAMVMVPTGWLAVWGEQTRQHAIEFIGMPPDRVKVLGAAQFEIYRSPTKRSREDICCEMNIDPTKKLILYAGSSKSVNEMEHLQVLDKAIESGEIPHAHVIFRPHPWRASRPDEPDYYEIQWKNVTMDPSMRNFYNSPKGPAPDKLNITDYQATHDILSAIDILASNVSTIMLEAALHGKPVLCMLSEEVRQKNWFLATVLNSAYFRELLDQLKIPVCTNYAEIPKLCVSLLKQAESRGFQQELIRKSRYFVDQNEMPYVERLHQLIDEILVNNSK